MSETNINNTNSNIEKRIFVGNLNNNKESCLKELFIKFNNFNNCELKSDKFDIFTNFAYININFKDQNSYQNFKNNFNNIKFKENLIKIDEAKLNWKENWELQNKIDSKESEKKEKFNNEQSLKFFKKIENINLSIKDQFQLIKGRLRKSKRPNNYKLPTFRTDLHNGKGLKILKLYKKKLWGVDKNKKLRDLTFNFENHKWLNGYDHVVETRLRNKNKSKIGIKNTLETSEDISTNINGNNAIEEEDVDQKIHEKETTNNVLSNLLENFDFDKPLNVVDQDMEEDYGSSDFEFKHRYDTSDDEVEDENEFKKNDISQRKNVDEEYKDVDRSHMTDIEKERKEQYYDNNKDNNNIEQEEDEYIPTFGKTNEIESNEDVKVGTISDVKTLRNLFNPNEENSNTFRLTDNNNDLPDIDLNKNKENDNEINIDEMTNIGIQPQNNFSITSNDHLFFPHFDSPFLIGQTQLNKIQNNNINILENWETEFYDNRSEWMKEMKRKKRDSLRKQFNKKNHNKSNLNILL